MDELQPVTSTTHSAHMIPVGSVSSVPASFQPLKQNEQVRFLEPTLHYGGGPQIGSNGSSAIFMTPSHSGLQQFAVSNSEPRQVGTMFSYPRPLQSQMLVKCKSPMENFPGNPLSPRVAMPNMNTKQLERRPWLNSSVPNQSSFQQHMQSGAGHLAAQQVLAQNKRTLQFQAIPPKTVSQKSSTSRGPSQGQPSPRVQNVSNEPVRSKLRESIRAALAMVTVKDKSSIQGVTSEGTGATVSEDKQRETEIDRPVSPVGCSEENKEKSNVNEQLVENQPSATSSQFGVSPQTHESVSQESNIIDVMPDEDSIAGQYFGKDDLLKGNGLSWVLDFDAWISEKEGHDPKKQNVGGAQEAKKSSSPQNLAIQIELELFKLFGGVNKKYKEKGRSLLFNLKDKNNPELRERVMSGVISPARLCSMSAEELASKELSEWRIAKAEEFDQLKILPDSDVDIRRLVKKTHKGEFQVEVEDDDVSVEVSIGSSSIPRIQKESVETRSPTGEKSDGDYDDKKENLIDKNNVENLQCTITIPSNESSDLMQGFIEDELKDAEFLPPIVSLDEFMESLHSEPPFENLPSDVIPAVSPENKLTEVPSDTKSAKHSPDGGTNVTSKAEDNMDKVLKQENDINPTNNQPQTEIPFPTVGSRGEKVWEGSLQLSIASKVAVTGFFKSGEKASSKEWPQTIEIKGRVRLDAFEKFMQDLYKSRSRYIMVVHMLLKEQDGKDNEALDQVVSSYVNDDRVGFAEPLRGLEMYLCPYHPKILDRIGKHMAKDHTEALSLTANDKGLIGVIVWRKPHVSPKSSSHHKHSLKRHQQEHYHSSKRHSHQDRNMNVNSSNLSHKYPVAPIVSSKAPIKVATQDDDLPPGFAQPASQDDDDLPEFNFSGGLSAPNPQNQPADQMRQLVLKYGQSAGSGQAAKSSRDEDDDIPEWQPQGSMPHQSILQQQNYPQLDQSVLQHLINQQQLLRPPWQQPLQPPMPTTQQNSVPGWLAPQQQQSSTWKNPQQGQFNGTQSRGF